MYLIYLQNIYSKEKEAKLKGKIVISTIRVGDINDLFMNWYAKTDFKKSMRTENLTNRCGLIDVQHCIQQ